MPAAIALLVFVVIAALVATGRPLAIDPAILAALRDPADPSRSIGPLWLAIFMRDITALGGFSCLAVAILLIAGYLLASRRTMLAFWLLIATGSGVAFSNALKHLFGRARPDVVPHLTDVYSTSFPSSHALNAAMIWLTLGFALAAANPAPATRRYILTMATLLPILVGLSRLWLGVHWPSDVAAGWAAGAFWALLWMPAIQRAATRAPGLH